MSLDSYCMPVTYRCNWFCSYCIVDTHNKPDIPFDQVLEKARNAPIGSKVSLTGGEPGILKANQLREIISILRDRNCKVQINSNGTIFKKPQIVDLVDSILYHVSEDLDINTKVVKKYKDKTTFTVVVTDSNIERLPAFLDKHNDIDIKIQADQDASYSTRIKLFREYRDHIEADTLAVIDVKEYQKKTIKL